jgi:replicative DNA helicase
MLKRIERMPQVDIIKAATFPTLCKAVDGFVSGELVVVTGATGCGKTLFCQSLTKDFCHDGVIPLWFTFEVSARFFLPKFALNAKDLQFYMPAELYPYSIDWVAEVIRRSKEKLGIEVAFIDHLHYIFDMSTSRNPSLDIGTVVRALKRLCVELDIIIFLCCHTTKTRVESADDVGLHKIRDSSLVAQEADTAIFVHRTTSDNGICKTESSFLKVCKARRTGDMSTVIETIKPNQYLAELAD